LPTEESTSLEVLVVTVTYMPFQNSWNLVI